MGGLLRAIFGGGRKPRRRSTPRRTTTRSRAPSREQQRAREQREKVARQKREQREAAAAEKRRQKELDRQAAAWVRADNARREKEERQRERERRVEQNRRIRQARSAAHVHGRYSKARGELEKQGFLPHEIDEIFEGGEDFFENPGRLRLPLALDFLKGGHRHTRANPSCGVCRANPSGAEASAMFHGRPDLTRNGRVVVGDIEEIVYRAPDGSKRAGAPWRHVAGDTGGLGRNRGRARLLADPNSGALAIDTRGSGVRFDNRRGIVG